MNPVVVSQTLVSMRRLLLVTAALLIVTQAAVLDHSHQNEPLDTVCWLCCPSDNAPLLFAQVQLPVQALLYTRIAAGADTLDPTLPQAVLYWSRAPPLT